MKIVSWNCNCSFRTKYHKILEMKPDIMVIPESENTNTLMKYKNEMQFNSQVWDGSTSHKGLSIFSCGEYSAVLANFYNPEFKFIIPVYIENHNKKFLLIGVWSKFVQNKTQSYITQVCMALEAYKDYIDENTIIAGDFNSNKLWDNLFNRKLNHSYMLNLLEKIGFSSVYHNFFNEKPGQETQPTHYYHRNKDKSFHIDYIFAHKNRKINNFSLGGGDWIETSDHIPLVLDIE